MQKCTSSQKCHWSSSKPAPDATVSRHFNHFPLFFPALPRWRFTAPPLAAWRFSSPPTGSGRTSFSSCPATRGSTATPRRDTIEWRKQRPWCSEEKKIKCVKPSFEALTRCVFQSAQICCTGNGSFMALGFLTFCFLTKNEASQKLAHDYFHTASILGD